MDGRHLHQDTDLPPEGRHTNGEEAMTIIWRFAVGLTATAVILFGFGGVATVETVATTTTTSTTSTTTTTMPVATTTSTSTTVAPTTTTTLPATRCAEWYEASLKAGFTPDDWSTLSRLLWRESRCIETALAIDDDDYSLGLTQVNLLAHKNWVGPIVQWNFDLLYNGELNLFVARILADRAEDAYGCKWQPWRLCG